MPLPDEPGGGFLSEVDIMTLTRLLQSIIFSLLAISLAWADDRAVIADFSTWIAKGIPPGWELKEKSGKALFDIKRDGDIPALHLKSVDSSFSLQGEVKVDVKQYPVLSWKWKVTQLPKGGDFRTSKTDDQAAQIFVAFTKTKAIVYIWDTTAPQGLMESTSPVPFMTVKVVVVRSGPSELGKWITETRNVYEDYKKFYGEEPPVVSGMRLQINSQHTETTAESWFADVVFKKQEQEGHGSGVMGHGKAHTSCRIRSISSPAVRGRENPPSRSNWQPISPESGRILRPRRRLTPRWSRG